MVNKSNRLHILDGQGKIIKSFGHNQAKDFVSAATSHNGTLIYAVSEESIMYCFDAHTEALVSQVQLSDNSEIIGITHHPLSNIIAANNDVGRVFLFKNS
jgi:WD40 repeat-containing protein SMU1